MPDRISTSLSRSRVFEYTLLGGLLVSDQLAKTVFSFFGERSFCNPDAAWGIPIPGIVFLVPVFLIGITVWWLKERERGFRIPIIMIIAGGIGNHADRLFIGCIRDFSFVFWFPAFNLADVFLTIGALSLIISHFQTQKRSRLIYDYPTLRADRVP